MRLFFLLTTTSEQYFAECLANPRVSVKTFTHSGAVDVHKDIPDGGADFGALIGSVLADTFPFVAGETGYDIVGDFEAWDYIRFVGFGHTSFSDIDKMTMSGPEAFFMDQGQEIRFWDVGINDFTNEQLIFT